MDFHNGNYVAHIEQIDDNTRVLVVLDDYPSAPECDGMDPVFRIDGDRVELVYGGYSDAADHVTEIETAIERLLENDTPREMAENLKVYLTAKGHKGVDVLYRAGGHFESDYIAVVTDTYRDKVGRRDYGKPATLGEWGHYLEGDVYYVVEQTRSTYVVSDKPTGVFIREFDEWEDVDALHGFYGDGYTPGWTYEDMAREAF